MDYEWTCEYCGSANSGKRCTQCGGPRPCQLRRLMWNSPMTTATFPYGQLSIGINGPIQVDSDETLEAIEREINNRLLAAL